MKIVQINMVDYGSTGRIMLSLAEKIRAQGHECETFSMRWKHQKKREGHNYFGTYFENAIHQVLGRVFGLGGCFSWLGTGKLIRALRRIDPDVIHVHNLHNAYVCIPRLIKYVNRNHKALLCTLHDCWTFTGKCPHFITSGCDKWIDGCSKCPSLKDYPQSFFDNSKRMWRKKKKWFGSVERLYIATPSRWLLEQVNRSFLKNAKTCVIHNGIDLGVFRYTPGEFREKNCLRDKFVILGVSFSWSYKKGLDVFARLAKDLDDRFRIVLVGIDPETEKQLPSSVVCIQRTKSPEELAGIYSAADLFVNPTREDTFPTVNMESIACGTPVLTFRTGGSTEALGSGCGCSVERDYDALREEILRIYETRPYARIDCIEYAQAFDLKKSLNAYMELYSAIIETGD